MKSCAHSELDPFAAQQYQCSGCGKCYCQHEHKVNGDGSYWTKCRLKWRRCVLDNGQFGDKWKLTKEMYDGIGVGYWDSGYWVTGEGVVHGGNSSR